MGKSVKKTPSRSPSPAPPSAASRRQTVTAFGGATTIRVMPIKYYLRNVFNEPTHDATPYKGKYFNDSQILEHLPRTIVIRPNMDVGELARSVKLNMDADADYGSVFPGERNDDNTSDSFAWQLALKKNKKTDGWDLTPNESMARGLAAGSAADSHVGLFALDYPWPEEGGWAGWSDHDKSGTFIPLSAIAADPEYYGDKERFPLFFNYHPDLKALKSNTKLRDRSDKKNGDFGDYFKKIVEKNQRFVKFAVCSIVAVVGLLLHNSCYLSAIVAAGAMSYGAWELWPWWSKKHKDRQAKYIRYREKWRWIKDDNVVRLWTWMFPILLHKSVYPPFGPFAGPEASDKNPLFRMPPDILKDKEGAEPCMLKLFWIFKLKLQTFVFGVVAWLLQKHLGLFDRLLDLGTALVQWLSPSLLHGLTHLWEDIYRIVKGLLTNQFATLARGLRKEIGNFFHATVRRLRFKAFDIPWRQITGGEGPTCAPPAEVCISEFGDLGQASTDVTGIVCRRILYRYEDQYLVHLEKLLVFGVIFLVFALSRHGEGGINNIIYPAIVFIAATFLLPDELYGLLPLGLSADTDFNTASEQSCL